MDSLSHTHSKHGNLASKVADGILADSRVCLGMSGARADDELCRFLRNQFLESNFIISIDGDSGAFKDEVLVYVPGERVVVVDQDKVGSCGDGCGRRRMAGRVVYQFQTRHSGLFKTVFGCYWIQVLCG